MTENIKYKVLARKYRPQTFADLIGQETLVQILTNAITTNRIANAYLLTGVRGVGKTTASARLLLPQRRGVHLSMCVLQNTSPRRT